MAKDDAFMLSLLDRLFKTIESLEETFDKVCVKFDATVKTKEQEVKECEECEKKTYQKTLDNYVFIIKALLLIVLSLLIALGVVNHQEIENIFQSIRGGG